MSKVKAGTKKDAPLPPRPKATEAGDAGANRLNKLIVRGSRLSASVQSAVTSAQLSWSTSEVTQLSLTVADPGFELWESGVFVKGAKIVLRDAPSPDLTLQVSALSLDGGPSGRGGFTVQARSWGVHLLKQRRGSLVMKNVSPSQFVRSEARKCGLKVVVQQSGRRASVSRDVPSKENADQKGAQRPSSWTTFQRLAQELGFLCFEYAGILYFGKPTWLLARSSDVATQIALPLPGAPAVWMAHTIPSISMSDDAEVPVEISGIQLHVDRFSDVRPGRALRLRGLEPFNDHYLTSSVTLDLLGNAPLDVAASSAVNPKPQPPAKKKKDTENRYDDGEKQTQTGTKSALDFVSMCLSASGSRYVFGAEASPSDPSPATLDCSELIEWACARVGVKFVDGSANQIARSKPISVSAALKTRGALLYKPGHVGISLGNGRSVEARNPRDGVGTFRAADIAWTAGGLIPGLRYR